MEDDPEHRSGMQSLEAWWAFCFRVLTGVAGVAILVGQAFGLAREGVALTVAGIGLCGPAVSAAAGGFIEGLRGSK